MIRDGLYSLIRPVIGPDPAVDVVFDGFGTKEGGLFAVFSLRRLKYKGPEWVLLAEQYIRDGSHGDVPTACRSYCAVATDVARVFEGVDTEPSYIWWPLFRAMAWRYPFRIERAAQGTCDLVHPVLGRLGRALEVPMPRTPLEGWMEFRIGNVHVDVDTEVPDGEPFSVYPVNVEPTGEHSTDLGAEALQAVEMDLTRPSAPREPAAVWAEQVEGILDAYSQTSRDFSRHLRDLESTRTIPPHLTKSLSGRMEHELGNMLDRLTEYLPVSPEQIELAFKRYKADALSKQASMKKLPGLGFSESVEMDSRVENAPPTYCGKCPACLKLKDAVKSCLAAVTPVFGTGGGDDAAEVWNRALYDFTCTADNPDEKTMTAKEMLKQ